MAALADLQARVSAAVVTGETVSVSPLLVGGRHPERRLDVHARHYRASLTRALLNRFPATAWLIGSEPVLDTAQRYVRSSPPVRPCLSEYGEGFPSALGASEWAAGVPYLRDFAELEYRVGAAALAVEREAVALSALAGIDVSSLPRVRLGLQAGARYVRVDSGVDALMQAHLSDTAPERFELSDRPAWLEVRGHRGAVRIERMTEDEFAFRAGVAGGLTLGDAAARALAIASDFDAGAALARLFASGLVTAVHQPDAAEEG